MDTLPLSIMDTVHGGVPEVIFKMKGLESLDLSYTGINCLPDIASELFTLQTLNLEVTIYSS
jgi:hypothetical protein